MMDPEDLQSQLLALRRLYGILTNTDQFLQDADSQNLDKNARLLLRSLLDDAAQKAFDAHAKMLGTRYKTSYQLWPIPQEQSREGQNLQPLFLRNTSSKYSSYVRSPSMDPKVDFVTGQGIYSEPTNQVGFSGWSRNFPTGESEFKLKRCRVCQKPKFKQLTKETSFQENEALALNNLAYDQTNLPLRNQSFKRSWEARNDPSGYGYGGSACSSNIPYTFNFVNPLCNLIDDEDPISKEASAMIEQIELCISDLQVAAASKQVSLLESDSESKLSQTGMRRIDPNSSMNQRTWNSTLMAPRWHELALEDQPVSMRTANLMLPSSQTMNQATEKVCQSELDEPKSDMFNLIKNQYEHIPEETYDQFRSSGVATNLYRIAKKDRPFNDQINRENLDLIQMAKKDTKRTSDTTQWLVQPHKSELQEAEIIRRKKPDKTYKDQVDHYRGNRGKHELVEPKRLVSTPSRVSDSSPVSSSNYSSSWETKSQSRQAYTSNSDSEEPSQPESSKSRSHEESEIYSVSSRDPSPYVSSSYESSGSKSRTRTKDHKRGKEKEPMRSSSYESSGLKSRTSQKDHKRGKQKELMRSSSYESSGSKSRAHTKDHKRGKQKEPMSSSSSESSGWKSRARTTVHKLGKHKETVKQQIGRLKQFKDKLAIIFHHHHHHDDDNKDDDDDDEDDDKHKKPLKDDDDKHKKPLKDDDDKHKKPLKDDDNHKKSFLKDAGMALVLSRSKDEKYAEKVIDKTQNKALVRKVADKNQKGQFKALVGGFMKHT